MNVQHDLTLDPGLEVASWALARTGKLEPQEDRGPLGHCQHWKSTGLSDWCLTYIYSALRSTEHFDFVTSIGFISVYPFGNESDSERWVFQSHTELKDRSSKPAYFGIQQNLLMVLIKDVSGDTCYTLCHWLPVWFTNHALYYLMEAECSGLRIVLSQNSQTPIQILPLLAVWS